MPKIHRPIWLGRLIPGALITLLLMMSASAVAADTASASPQAATVGTPIAFAGAGFSANESLSLWEIGPDGTITPLPGLQADASGAFSTSITLSGVGQWQVTAHGITSGNETVKSYTVDTSVPAVTPAGSLPSVAATGAPGVPVGTPVTFSGTGFTASEAISLWETGPDATVTPLAGIVADANGAFTTSASFPSAGQWQITAHGITSGAQTIGTYAVGVAGSTTTTTTTVATSSAPAVAIGAPVTFSGTGFAANEAISLWTTNPSSAVTPLGGIGSDGNGAFTTTVTFPTAGQWEITAHGTTSAKEIVGTYAVGTTAAPTTTTAGAAAPQATVGSPVAFSGTGFTASEVVALWATGPDSTVTPLTSIQADVNGAFSASPSFASVGFWQLTAHGTTSGHEVIAGYTVVNNGTAGVTPASPALAGMGAPVTVGRGVIVTFAPAGFGASEVVNAWMTAPDGTVVPLQTTQASSTGQVTITTSFPTAGLWQVTAHGASSGQNTVGRYQVTTS